METAEHRALWEQHQQANYASVVAAAGPTMTTTARTRLLRRRVLMVETYVGAVPEEPADYHPCTACQTWKHAREFIDDHRTTNSLHCYCNACRRAYGRGYDTGRRASTI